MKLELTHEQTMLQEAVSKAMLAQRDPARIRDAEKAGFDARAWKISFDLELPLMRASDAHGGSGSGLLDAVLVSAAVSKSLALIPIADVLAASGMLSDLGTPPALDILKRIGQGEIISLALADADTQPEQLILFGQAAGTVIYRSGQRIFAQPGGGTPVDSLGKSAANFVRLVPTRALTLAEGAGAIARWEATIEEWKILNAASIASMAKQSLMEACEYARERTAFGRTIGSFQGLAHPLADSLADVDSAHLLIWRAVGKLAAGNDDAGAAISQAVWWTSHRAVVAAQRAMRAFGGYGMTLEYDAQIFFKRIMAQSLAFGDPDAELELAGRRLFLDEKVSLPAAGELDIDFELAGPAQKIAATIRDVFVRHVNPQRQAWAFDTDDGHDPVLFQALAARRVLFPDWPEEYGGLAADAEAGLAAESVYNEFDWSYTIVTVTSLFGKILMRFGSDRAKAEILPRFANGTAVGALCYSEPSCGSDIFAARTKARRDGEDWIIDGQKMFTSQGHIADYGLMLARTGDGPKHESITLFALPLRDPLYRCEPIATIGGERTNVTFYDGMRLSDAYRIGEIDGGTKVLAAALMMEQGASELYVGKLQQLVANGLEWAREKNMLAADAPGQSVVLRRLARVATFGDATDVLSRRAVAASLSGNTSKHFGPMGKLFGSEAWVACSRLMLETIGPRGLAAGPTAAGRIEKSFRQSTSGTIYAGTSEIQRSLIAEAGLNLPRSRS